MRIVPETAGRKGRPTPWPSLTPLLFLVITSLPLSEAGCYSPIKQCCRGRNNTCVSVDDGLRRLPPELGGPVPTTARPFRYTKNGQSQEIGQLVKVASDRYDSAYNQYERERGGRPRTSSYKEYIFGMPVRERPQGDIIEELPKPKRHLLIRYEIIAEHLPLTVLTSNRVEYDNNMKLMYLEASPTTCYCDEGCIELGDCCSDYTFVCPRVDCEVGEWSGWSGCLPDYSKRCGTGTQQRTRQVVQQADHGGTRCPALKEARTCFKGCERTGSSFEEVTTVALLLDYHYNGTRSRHSKRHKWMTSLARANKTSYYCVEYQLGWVNHNCVNPKLVAMLFKGNTICAECQPEAQVHRKSLRCASDLNDGDSGFWKLIGPKSCNGIWFRVQRTDNCKCSRDLPLLDRFLLV